MRQIIPSLPATFKQVLCQALLRVLPAIAPEGKARHNTAMDRVLALAACSGRAEVALAAPELPAPAVVALASPSPRADLLLKGVALLLEAANLEASGVQLVVATRGPGSFTGIRNTLACTLGLARGLDVPAHAFSSLLAQAARCRPGRLLAAQPARKGLAYVQEFEYHQGWVEAGEVAVRPLAWLREQSLPVVAPAGLPLLPGTPTAAGERTTAEALLLLAQWLDAPDPASLEPLYVEAFVPMGTR